jgi:hypothetical protein
MGKEVEVSTDTLEGIAIGEEQKNRRSRSLLSLMSVCLSVPKKNRSCNFLIMQIRLIGAAYFFL